MEVHLLLGGNIGNRKAYLQFAKFHIRKRIGNILSESSIYETAAWGGIANKAFYNQVIIVDTPFSPIELLNQNLAIEKMAGRIRYKKWDNRTLDIDILFYENQIIEKKDLIIPHPAIQNRLFTLIPLCELNCAYIHPKLGKKIKDLLDICPDQNKVLKIN